jgi:peptide/nickel transport system permease protein
MTDVAVAPATFADLSEVTPSPRGLSRRALRLWRTRFGLILVVALVAVALLGPLFAPHEETEFVGTPNVRHVEGTLLGTDYFGQDVLSRFLYGGDTILVLAALSTALALLLGVTIGLVAAYSRGRVDDILMRVMDISLAFPQLLLALVALTTIGPKSWLIVLIVAFTQMPRIARVTRGAAVPVVERDFISAAEALGESRLRILRSELLPNVSGPLLVEANLRLTYSLFIIASLGFLGFATSVNAADWGLMVQQNRSALSVQPWGTLLPAIAIAVLTIGTGLITDGIARAAAGIDRGRAD